MRFTVGDSKQLPAVVACRHRSGISSEVEVLVNGVVHFTFSTDGDIVLDNVPHYSRVQGIQYEDNGEIKVWRED